jgi:hypothetical protein
VQVVEALGAVDVLRMTGRGGDPAIKALSDLGERQRPTRDCFDEREIEPADPIAAVAAEIIPLPRKCARPIVITSVTRGPGEAGEREECIPCVCCKPDQLIAPATTPAGTLAVPPFRREIRIR